MFCELKPAKGPKVKHFNAALVVCEHRVKSLRIIIFQVFVVSENFLVPIFFCSAAAAVARNFFTIRRKCQVFKKTSLLAISILKQEKHKFQPLFTFYSVLYLTFFIYMSQNVKY
jgi:hypothetical protein